MRKWAILSLVFLLPTSALADSFYDGLTAAEEGRFHDAYVIWWPLARFGDADSQHNLAVLFDRGLGVERNPKEAIRWYKKAAEQDHPDAQNNLGMMYFYGQGVNRDLEKARQWLERAARQHHTQAESNLDEVYSQLKTNP